jgi:hypothetical protein
MTKPTPTRIVSATAVVLARLDVLGRMCLSDGDSGPGRESGH